MEKLRPQNVETEHVRITLSGNIINYPDDKRDPTIKITTIKMHLNSVVYTPEAKYLCTDVHTFYLNTIMKYPDYMSIKVKLVPVEIMDQYELWYKVHDGHVYMKIVKVLYLLPQAGILSYKQLFNDLKPYVYGPCKSTQGLWTHKTNAIKLTLCVD